MDALWGEPLFVDHLWRESRGRRQGIVFPAAVGGAASTFSYVTSEGRRENCIRWTQETEKQHTWQAK